MSAEIVLVIRIILVILLYSFLGLTLLTLWRTTFSPSKQDEMDAIKINVINNNDNQSRTFVSPEIYLGRDENASFQLMDQSASNLHARIFLKKLHWWVEDLNSTNGTYINDEKISAPTRIFDQDVIKCGTTELRVEYKLKEDDLDSWRILKG